MRFSGPIAPIMKTHPLTGEPIVPVGIVNGKVVWPMMGGAPDPDDDDDDKDDDDRNRGADDDKKGKRGDNDDDTGGDDDDDDDKDDIDAIRRRMEAADRRATKAEKRLKEIEDAKKDDLTKATERAEELEKEIESKDDTIRTLRLQNAFLTANKHKWHDPDDALDVAERKGYLEDVVKDDGSVDKKALGSALDRLAKEKGYLVATEKKEDDEPGEPSGEPAGGRSDNSKDTKAKKAQLQRRFPVLNR